MKTHTNQTMPRNKKHSIQMHKKMRDTSPKYSVQREKWDPGDVPNYLHRINPDLYSIRVTRRISKIMEAINNFTIIEVYKCMPLLGDEYNIPYWEVHAVKFSVIFSM